MQQITLQFLHRHDTQLQRTTIQWKQRRKAIVNHKNVKHQWTTLRLHGSACVMYESAATRHAFCFTCREHYTSQMAFSFFSYLHNLYPNQMVASAGTAWLQHCTNTYKPQCSMIHCSPISKGSQETNARFKSQFECSSRILCSVFYFWLNNN